MDPLYFVMLDNQDGKMVLPLVDGENVALFQTVEAARQVALENPMGSHFGYEIFERGNGEL